MFQLQTLGQTLEKHKYVTCVLHYRIRVGHTLQFTTHRFGGESVYSATSLTSHVEPSIMMTTTADRSQENHPLATMFILAIVSICPQNAWCGEEVRGGGVFRNAGRKNEDRLMRGGQTFPTSQLLSGACLCKSGDVPFPSLRFGLVIRKWIQTTCGRNINMLRQTWSGK